MVENLVSYTLLGGVVSTIAYAGIELGKHYLPYVRTPNFITAEELQTDESNIKCNVLVKTTDGKLYEINLEEYYTFIVGESKYIKLGNVVYMRSAVVSLTKYYHYEKEYKGHTVEVFLDNVAHPVYAKIETEGKKTVYYSFLDGVYIKDKK